MHAHSIPIVTKSSQCDHKLIFDRGLGVPGSVSENLVVFYVIEYLAKAMMICSELHDGFR